MYVHSNKYKVLWVCEFTSIISNLHSRVAVMSFDADGSHENVTIGTSGAGYRDSPSRRLN